MAARKPKPGKTRYRRSPDEMIADLKKKIEDIEKRKAAKAMKTRHEGGERGLPRPDQGGRGVKSSSDADLSAPSATPSVRSPSTSSPRE